MDFDRFCCLEFTTESKTLNNVIVSIFHAQRTPPKWTILCVSIIISITISQSVLVDSLTLVAWKSWPSRRAPRISAANSFECNVDTCLHHRVNWNQTLESHFDVGMIFNSNFIWYSFNIDLKIIAFQCKYSCVTFLNYWHKCFRLFQLIQMEMKQRTKIMKIVKIILIFSLSIDTNKKIVTNLSSSWKKTELKFICLNLAKTLIIFEIREFFRYFCCINWWMFD